MPTIHPCTLDTSTALPSAFISCIISWIHLLGIVKKASNGTHTRGLLSLPIKNINTPNPSTLKPLLQLPLIGCARSASNIARSPAAHAAAPAATSKCRQPVAKHGDGRDRPTCDQGRDVQAVRLRLAGRIMLVLLDADSYIEGSVT